MSWHLVALLLSTPLMASYGFNPMLLSIAYTGALIYLGILNYRWENPHLYNDH